MAQSLGLDTAVSVEEEEEEGEPEDEAEKMGELWSHWRRGREEGFECMGGMTGG